MRTAIFRPVCFTNNKIFVLIAATGAPDAETVAKLSIYVSSQGDVRGETLRAFSEEEFYKMISSLP